MHSEAEGLLSSGIEDSLEPLRAYWAQRFPGIQTTVAGWSPPSCGPLYLSGRPTAVPRCGRTVSGTAARSSCPGSRTLLAQAWPNLVYTLGGFLLSKEKKKISIRLTMYYQTGHILIAKIRLQSKAE